MQFDPKDLETLGGVLLTKGAPALANMLGGPIAGDIASILVPQLAQAFGLPADAPAPQVAAAVQADPNAADKLATFTEQNKFNLAVLQLQVDQNNTELKVDGPPWLKFFYGGWRPAMGWMCGPVLVLYCFVLVALDSFGLLKVPPTPQGFFAWVIMIIALPLWAGLAGLRTYERTSGVALDSVLSPKKK
jgi:hypothetical protein